MAAMSQVDKEEEKIKVSSAGIDNSSSVVPKLYYSGKNCHHNHQQRIFSVRDRENNWMSPTSSARKNSGRQTVRVFSASSRCSFHPQKFFHQPRQYGKGSSQKWTFVPAEAAIPLQCSGRTFTSKNWNSRSSCSFETHTSDEIGLSESRHFSKDGPDYCVISSMCCRVSNQILDNFFRNHQQLDLFDQKLKLRDILYGHVSEELYQKCGMYIVGSSLNGFGTKDSDLDICLMVVNKQIDRNEAVKILHGVKELLETTELLNSAWLIDAKEPILRLKCNAPFENILVDLNANSLVSIQNTHLLFYYAKWDWRVRPLALAVKEWARRNDINSPRNSTLSSYSLILMVIHFLQCGTTPALLPVLHDLYPEKFSADVDIRYLNISEPLHPFPGFLFPANRGSLGVLFRDFLRYYANYFSKFSFELENAISVRLGKKLDRSTVANPNSSPLFIEAHSAYDKRIFENMRDTFARSCDSLERNWDLTPLLTNTVSPESETRG